MYGVMSEANTFALRRGSIAPNTVGPSMIPPSTSPITRGWPIRGIRLPTNRRS